MRHGTAWGLSKAVCFKDRKTDQPIACLENDNNQATNASLKSVPDPYLLCVPSPLSRGSDLFRHCRGQENPWWNVRSFFRFFGKISHCSKLSDQNFQKWCWLLCVMLSGTHWGGTNRPNITNWRGVRDSCTCSYIRIGLRAQTPTVGRRGNANKIPMMEVPKPFSSFLPISFIFIFYIIYFYIWLVFFSWTVFLLLFLFLSVFLDHLVTLPPPFRTTHDSVILFQTAFSSNFHGGFLITVKIFILCLFW